MYHKMKLLKIFFFLYFCLCDVFDHFFYPLVILLDDLAMNFLNINFIIIWIYKDSYLKALIQERKKK